MISITLTDDTETLELKALERPFVETPLESATDIETLGFNVFTDFIATKRSWSNTWKIMTNAEYQALVGFYNRQITSGKYPLLTMDFYSVSSVPVRMKIGAKNIRDHDGVVEDVNVSFRETVQGGETY